MSGYVSRDPFAREELHRTFVRGVACAWCGNQSRTTNKRGSTVDNAGSWRYRVETDGGRTYEDTKTFCSKSCRESYQRQESTC